MLRFPKSLEQLLPSPFPCGFFEPRLVASLFDCQVNSQLNARNNAYEGRNQLLKEIFIEECLGSGRLGLPDQHNAEKCEDSHKADHIADNLGARTSVLLVRGFRSGKFNRWRPGMRLRHMSVPGLLRPYRISDPAVDA